jgi:parallel beta-helix repeat protein
MNSRTDMNTRTLGAGVLTGACALAVLLPAGDAAGQAIEPKMITVDCTKGKSITRDLEKLPAARGLVVKVKGPCTENVLITRDDVTLQADGTPVVLTPADAGQDTIRIDGARRVVIDGFIVSGGRRGVTGVRGATFDLRNCTVQGAAGPDGLGVVASWGSMATVDACTVTGNRLGIVAANGSSIVVTDSVVEANLATGIVAVRNAHVRVGQDVDGSAIPQPVTIRDNGGSGLSIIESSAGILFGGLVEGNSHNGIFVGNASHALIGTGSNSHIAGTLIRNNTREGAVVGSSGDATVVASTITANGSSGVVVTSGGSARIGIPPGGGLYAGNTITGNGSAGIAVAASATADVGGNTISGNGTNAASGSRYGVVVTQATVRLVGGNVITGNAASGLFVGRAGVGLVGEPAFGLPTTNEIAGNGFGDPTKSGIFVFEGGVVETRSGTTISGNDDHGVQLFLGGVADLRATTIRDQPGAGVSADLRSTVRLRDASVIELNDGDGVRIGRGSAVDFRGGVVTSVNGNGGWGLQCFDAESSFSGDTSGIGPNGAGAISPACTGF